MKFSNPRFIFAIFAAAIVMAASAFVFAGRISEAQDAALVTTETSALPETGALATGRDIIALLDSLKKIILDESIFEDPAFLSLKDFHVDLPEQQRSRPNPFAPIGQDVVLPESTGTSIATPLGGVPTAPLAPAAPLATSTTQKSGTDASSGIGGGIKPTNSVFVGE